MNNSHIYGIFFDCSSKKRCNDCVVNQVIHLSYQERTSWFENLDEGKKMEVVSHHMNCSGNRK
jgi:hypothetical protein